MKLIDVFAWLVRRASPGASRARAGMPRAITVPAPRDRGAAPAAAAADPAVRLADFRCRVPPSSALVSPPTLRS